MDAETNNHEKYIKQNRNKGRQIDSFWFNFW
ncbi:hypothetical protein J801_4791, partial [Acinetobacter baumannii 45002_8]